MLVACLLLVLHGPSVGIDVKPEEEASQHELRREHFDGYRNSPHSSLRSGQFASCEPSY